MSDASVSAVLAVIFGVLLVPVLFLPYVAWSYRRRNTLGLGHALIVVLGVIYLMALWTYTILPLPDAATLDCVAGGTPAQLVPFGSLADVDLAANGLRDRALLQLLLNIALFVPFGMIARHLLRPRRLWWVLVAGLGVSLLIELTQLTGIWGLYPCSYRVFDVDDLLTNTLGAGLGILLAPLLRWIPGQDELSPDEPRVVGRGRRLVGMAVDYVTVAVSAYLISIALLVVGQQAGWFGEDLPVDPLSGWVTLGTALVLLLGVALLTRGATPGQVATLVRPVRADGAVPGRRQLLVRWVAGSGGYFTLSALGSITGLSALDSIANAWLVLSALAVLVRHPRGISGYVARLTVADTRDPVAADTVAAEADPRSLWIAVITLTAGLYLLGSALTAVATLAPWVGMGLAVAGLVALVLASLAFVPLLVANVIVMLRREGLGTSTLLPLAAVLAFLGLFALLAVALWSGLTWLLAVSLSVLAVTAYLGFLFLAFLLYGQWYARRDPVAGADAVVVLGSRVFGDRVPPLLAARIDRGIEVLGQQLAHDPDSPMVLVCSGGQGPDEDMAEGDAMARYALDHGVAAGRVLAETQSRTTEENLTLSTQLLNQRGIGTDLIVTTNDYHAFRAALIARELGVSAQVVGARTARYYFPSAILREFVAVLSRSPAVHVAVAVGSALLIGSLTLLISG